MKYFDATKTNHTQEMIYMVFVANDQAPEVLAPCEPSLHFPSAPIKSQHPAVLGIRFLRCGEIIYKL